MILFLLAFITFIFILINLYLTKYDYMHPSVVFCLMFFICEVMCIIFRNMYAITLHYQTLLVLCIGFLIFTLLTYLFKQNSSNYLQQSKIQYIEIPKILVILLIVLQILTILSLVSYLKDIYYTYTLNTTGNYSELIKTYDALWKFHPDILRSLNIHKPLIYRIGYPVIWSLGFLVIYIIINNFIAIKKIEKLCLISSVLLCTFIILMGSRYELFKIIVFSSVLFYVLGYRKGYTKIGDIKFFIRLLLLALIVIVLMFLTLFLIGRASTCTNIFQYLFIYIGAQIVNLDNFLINNDINIFTGSSYLFGQYSFAPLYEYIGKIFHIQTLYFPTIETFNVCNNLSTGNVYTTYKYFICDFGYSGVVLLLSIIAIYFVVSYRNCINKKNNTIFDYELIVLAYFFSDLMFLFFSNFFFSGLTSALFIKSIIIVLIMNFIIKICFSYKKKN